MYWSNGNRCSEQDRASGCGTFWIFGHCAGCSRGWVDFFRSRLISQNVTNLGQHPGTYRGALFYHNTVTLPIFAFALILFVVEGERHVTWPAAAVVSLAHLRLIIQLLSTNYKAKPRRLACPWWRLPANFPWKNASWGELAASLSVRPSQQIRYLCLQYNT